MKKIIVLSVLLVSILQINFVNADDDVYDAPKPKKVKSKQIYTSPTQQTEKTVPYSEEGSSVSRTSSSGNDMQNDYQIDNNYVDENYSGSSFGYSDRIRRFHNPSIQFNYGWNNWNNNFYDPWNTYNNNFGWNNWNSYAFTPSWTYGYNNFYNPFCNNAQIIIIQPGFSSWYNNGFYNPWSSWNNYSWNSWNNYGFSPYCSNAIYNYGYSNYSGYYDNNRKNVIYTPRTGTYGNSNTSNGNRNYNSTKNYPSNTNSGSWNATGNGNTNSSNNVTNGNSTPPKTNKWNNNNSNSNSGSWSNPYKNNNNTNTTPSNNSNNNNWQNNNSNSDNNSGIKIGSRPK